jgi:hypothetical protein
MHPGRPWLVGFSVDALFNFDPGAFDVWGFSNQVRADLSFNLPLKLLKNVDYDVEDTLLRIGSFYQLFATNWRPAILLVLPANMITGNCGHVFCQFYCSYLEFGCILSVSKH